MEYEFTTVTNKDMIKTFVISYRNFVESFVEEYHNRNGKGYEIPFYAVMDRLNGAAVNTLLEICSVTYRVSEEEKNLIIKLIGQLDAPAEELAQEIEEIIIMTDNHSTSSNSKNTKKSLYQ